MAPVLHKPNSSFKALAGWICRRPWPVIIGLALLTAFLTYPLPRLKMDSSSQALLHRDDPVLTAYRAFVDMFGSDEFIIVAVESPHVFSVDFLKKLKSLHLALEKKTPNLDEIYSLINVISVKDDSGRFLVEKLLKRPPQNQGDLDRLKKRVMGSSLYRNRLISETGDLAVILLTLQPEGKSGPKEDPLAGLDSELGGPAAGPGGRPEKPKVSQGTFSRSITAIKDIVAAYRAEDFKIYLAGPGIISKTVNEIGMQDMSLFVGLALLVICVLLLAMFRRPSGLVLPPMIVGLATSSAMGLMVHTGVVITPPTIMLPSFLLAVGIADSVHILTLFYAQFDRTGDKQAAIAHALGHSGQAILMTSLTTAVGLGSFVTAEVSSVAHIGIFGSAGVLLALGYTIFLLPALLAVLPIKAKPARKVKAAGTWTDRALDWLAAFSCGRPKTILAVGSVVLLVALTGMGKLTFSHHPIEWLPQDLPERLAAEKIDRAMNGFMTLDILVDTGRSNGARDPALLAKIDRLAEQLKGDTGGRLKVGQTSALPDLIKEINRALHENRPEDYRVPDNRRLIAQELLLFSNSGASDLDNWVDPDYRVARVSIQTPWANASVFASFIDRVTAKFRQALGPGFKVTATGQMCLFGQTVTAAINSTAKSYLTAIVVITVMMILVIGRLKLGLISMIPNLAPIIVVLGLMGWLHIPFDLFSLVIGSIAIGLVVDDTIHFMHAYRRYSETSPDVVHTVRETYRVIGRAMIVTTVVLSSASFIFMLSRIKAMVNFGFLIGLTIVLALVMDIIVTPALLIVLSPESGPGRSRPKPAQENGG